MALDNLIARLKADHDRGGAVVEYKCPKCKDTRIILTKDSSGHVTARDCECAAGEYALRKMKASGLGKEEIDKGFKDFKTGNNACLKKGFETAKDYYFNYQKNHSSGHRDNSLMICGKSGTGKTLLAMAVMNNILSLGLPATYIPYRDLITACKESYDNDVGYQETIKRYRQMPLIFIDDLFKGGTTEADIKIMYDLINARYLSARPVIITTELSRTKLQSIDEAISGRLVEMAKSHTIFFDDSVPNYRLKEGGGNSE